MSSRSPVTICKYILIAAMLVAAPWPALADQGAASNCRATLSPEAGLIYDTVLPLVTPTAVVPDVIKQQTRSLVLAGKVKRATAPDSAKAAGQCVLLLRK